MTFYKTLKALEIIIIVLLLILIFFLKYYFKLSIDKDVLIILSIAIALITFVIPFMWNAYQMVLETKKEVFGGLRNQALIDYFYNKKIILFEIFLQYPIAISILIWIFIFSFFPLEKVIISFPFFFIYLIFIPQIFNWIEIKTSKNLLEFLEITPANSIKLDEIFKEIWRLKDKEIVEKLNLKTVTIFEKFAKKIDKLIGKENDFVSIYKLLNNFVAYLDNRTIIFLCIMPKLTQKILSWHFTIWDKAKSFREKNQLDIWGDLKEILLLLNLTIKNITKKFLEADQNLFFFGYFKKYVKENENNDGYLEDLFETFYSVFFENIADSPKNSNIWTEFPKDWEITLSNLTNSKTKNSWITFKEYYNWAQERIWSPKEDFDKKLEQITRNLFPDVDPIIWAKILIFVISPYGENRIKSIIEHPWNFGFVGKSIGGSWGPVKGSEEKFFEKLSERTKAQQEILFKNTFELAKYIFKNEFTEIKLKQYINQAKELNYSKESKEESKTLSLISIFEKML